MCIMMWTLFQTYTQYIPLSVYDLQTWMSSPSIYVYDCSNAAIIVESFKQFCVQREQESEVEERVRGVYFLLNTMCLSKLEINK